MLHLAKKQFSTLKILGALPVLFELNRLHSIHMEQGEKL